jgi:hypothetical protein
LANISTFGNKRGPLIHPERVVGGPTETDAPIAEQLKGQKMIPKARKSQIDFLERIANSDLRESIMRNDDPGSFIGHTNDPTRMKDVFVPKTIFDFIRPKGSTPQ